MPGFPQARSALGRDATPPLALRDINTDTATPDPLIPGREILTAHNIQGRCRFRSGRCADRLLHLLLHHLTHHRCWSVPPPVSPPLWLVESRSSRGVTSCRSSLGGSESSPRAANSLSCRRTRTGMVRSISNPAAPRRAAESASGCGVPPTEVPTAKPSGCRPRGAATRG